MEYYNLLSLANISETINGVYFVEEWRPILGYEGLYEISSFGRVKSLFRETAIPGAMRLQPEKIKKQAKSKKGYMYVMLCKNGANKNRQVHRLVAQAFIENNMNKPRVNHICGIKHDNRFHQLEWVTASEDELHSYRVLGKKSSKSFLGRIGDLHPRSKGVVCPTLNVEFGSLHQCAKKLGISQGNLSLALSSGNGITNGLYFRYKN